MKRKILLYLLITVALYLSACNFAYAQSPSRITQRCPAPNGSSFGEAAFAAVGDLNIYPCPSRSTIFTGNVDFSGAIITGAITGSGTVNFVPRFTAASAIGNTPLSWDGTTYIANNTALDSEFTFSLLPSSTVGRFLVGDFTTSPTTYFDINRSAGYVSFQTSAINRFSLSNGSLTARADNSIDLQTQTAFTVGDTQGTSNGTTFSVTPLASTFTLSEIGNDATLDIQAAPTVFWNRQLTSSGTGDITANATAGNVRLAGGATAVTVTNNLVFGSGNTLVLATVQTNDTTCAVKNVVSTSGSFTINMTAACTGITSVGWFLVN